MKAAAAPADRHQRHLPLALLALFLPQHRSLLPTARPQPRSHPPWSRLAAAGPPPRHCTAAAGRVRPVLCCPTGPATVPPPAGWPAAEPGRGKTAAAQAAAPANLLLLLLGLATPQACCTAAERHHSAVPLVWRVPLLLCRCAGCCIAGCRHAAAECVKLCQAPDADSHTATHSQPDRILASCSCSLPVPIPCTMALHASSSSSSSSALCCVGRMQRRCHSRQCQQRQAAALLLWEAVRGKLTQQLQQPEQGSQLAHHLLLVHAAAAAAAAAGGGAGSSCVVLPGCLQQGPQVLLQQL
ncbi:hypothetical protein COO60DRAFT_711803 [Scenedesmus sp. NREL 46B-D3]|nr:hypothetical protein COO60DRAFT_711803 [Scenedesmus sp. NREL 46B-D3]